MGDVIYLFCFARSSHLPSMKGRGVDGQSPLFLHGFQDIVATLCKVSVEDFCGPEAECRMQDLSWIGPRACRHEEVVEEVMGYSPVLPVRFGTIFSSMEVLEKRLKEHYDGISRFLDLVMDQEEWSVKGFIDKARAEEEVLSVTLAKEAGHLSSLTPGKRYFQEQRIQSHVEKEVNHWLKQVCRGLWDELSPHGTDFCERRLLPPDASGSDRHMVLNWAFLVPTSSLTHFRKQIDRANGDHGERGLVLESSGPWPPYSFCPSFQTESSP